MGKVVLNLVSRDTEISHVQVLANSPSFSAITSFRCENKVLHDFGIKLKGFPKSVDERVEYVIGAGKGKAEFNFKTIGTSRNTFHLKRHFSIPDQPLQAE